MFQKGEIDADESFRLRSAAGSAKQQVHCALVSHIGNPFLARYFIILYISMFVTIYYFNAAKKFPLGAEGTGVGPLLLFNPL
jgi:hypothetical protein